MREETARLVPSVLAAFGRIDILVNNAGTMQRAPAAQHPDEMWDETIEVNLSSVFLLSRAAGAHMLERGAGGKIVNIASMLSFQGGITVPGYAAAKGGVAQLTKALANEWASQRINVNAIAPGYMETDNTSALQADPVRSRQIGERIPAGRWGEPEDLGGRRRVSVVARIGLRERPRSCRRRRMAWKIMRRVISRAVGSRQSTYKECA